MAGAVRSQLGAARRPFSPVQWAAILGSLTVLVWSVPGLIVNPDFGIGDAARSVTVLGVDMNGWHALSGFLVAVHFATSAIFLAGAAHYYLVERAR